MFANVDILLNPLIPTANIDNRLRGFVVVGDFNPALDEDIHWPKWKDKTLPDNRGLSEIKLLGCEKGFGRLMFSWVATIAVDSLRF